MGTKDIGLSGSVLSEENESKLYAARLILTAIKKYKLELRHQKNKDCSWAKDDIVSHLWDEVKELAAALVMKDKMALLGELADVSNIIDILTMVILDET